MLFFVILENDSEITKTSEKKLSLSTDKRNAILEKIPVIGDQTTFQLDRRNADDVKCKSLFERSGQFQLVDAIEIGKKTLHDRDKKLLYRDPHPFQCYLCPKKYSKFPTLKDHMIIHTHEKSIKCKYCKAKFRTMRQYKFHERSHVEYVCDVCSKKCDSAHMLDVSGLSLSIIQKSKISRERERKKLANS